MLTTETGEGILTENGVLLRLEEFIMAQSTRIDILNLLPDGRVEIVYTAGEPPLPGSSAGTGLMFGSQQDFRDALTALENELAGEKLALIQAAVAFKKDPTLGATFLASARGKTASIDLTGSVTAIAVG